METKKFQYIIEVLKNPSLFSKFSFAEKIYALSQNDNDVDMNECKEIIFDNWVELVSLNEVCDVILIITELIADYFDCGDALCNLTPQTGKKKVLTFLHENGYKGNAEIAYAAHNNFEFLEWMYESKMEWDDSLQFFDDIKDIKVLDFLEKNMGNWKDGMFPNINIKKAKS